MSEPVTGDVYADFRRAAGGVSPRLPRWVPQGIRRCLNRLYWDWYDARDYLAGVAGAIPAHTARRFFYRKLLGAAIGADTSVHRGCRFYRPVGVRIGAHTVVNRDVLLDGRMA